MSIVQTLTQPFVNAADKTKEVATNTKDKVKTAIVGPEVQPQANQIIAPPTTTVIQQTDADSPVPSDSILPEQQELVSPSSTISPIPKATTFMSVKNTDVPTTPIQIAPSTRKNVSKNLKVPLQNIPVPVVSATPKSKLTQNSTASASNASTFAIVGGVLIFVLLLLSLSYFLHRQLSKVKIKDLEAMNSSVKENSYTPRINSGSKTGDAFADLESVVLYNQAQDNIYYINPYTETYYNTPLSELPSSSNISCDMTEISSCVGDSVDVYCLNAHSISEESMFGESSMH